VKLPRAITTARFTIRPHRRCDLAPFTEFLTDPVATEHLGLPQDERTPDAAKARLERVIASVASDEPVFFLAVVDRATEAYVGSCGLHPLPPSPDGGFAIYYNVQPAWQGRGVATEAAAAIIDYAFAELGARRIEAYVFRQNVASVRVARKLGLSERGPHVHQGRAGLRYALERGDG